LPLGPIEPVVIVSALDLAAPPPCWIWARPASSPPDLDAADLLATGSGCCRPDLGVAPRNHRGRGRDGTVAVVENATREGAAAMGERGRHSRPISTWIWPTFAWIRLTSASTSPLPLAPPLGLHRQASTPPPHCTRRRRPRARARHREAPRCKPLLWREDKEEREERESCA
jgi:hypothetical protein